MYYKPERIKQALVLGNWAFFHLFEQNNVSSAPPYPLFSANAYLFSSEYFIRIRLWPFGHLLYLEKELAAFGRSQ